MVRHLHRVFRCGHKTMEASEVAEAAETWSNRRRQISEAFVSVVFKDVKEAAGGSTGTLNTSSQTARQTLVHRVFSQFALGQIAKVTPSNLLSKNSSSHTLISEPRSRLQPSRFLVVYLFSELLSGD